MPAPMLLEQFAATSAAAGWTPASLTNLISWFDFSDTAMITEASGLVSDVAPSGGSSSAHLVQATGGNKPLTGNTLNGLNVLRFDTTHSDYLTAAIGTLTQPSTILIVLSSDTVSGTRIPYDSNHGTNRHQTWLGSDDWQMYAGNILTGLNTGTTEPAQLVSVFNGASSVLYLDGTSIASGDVGSLSMTDLMVGASAGANGWDGIIAEIVVMNAAADAGELAAWTAYAETKWGVGTFSPYDLPGLVAWYDASAAGTITDAGGGRVSQWDNLSVNPSVGDLVQATSGLRPLTGARTINGLNVLDLDEARGDSMTGPINIDGAQPITYLAVYENDTTANNQRVFDTGGRLIYDAGATRVMYAGAVVSGTAGTTNAEQIVATYNGASSTLWVNGVSDATGNPGTNGFSGGTVYVGQEQPGIGSPFDGAIAELVVVYGAVSAGDRALWNGYVADKWGVWSPAMLPNVVAWYDASDTSTITDAGSGAVSAWADKSGNGYTATQGTGANRPITGTRTVNGLNGLDFDGTNDYLAASIGSHSQPFTMFAVYSIDTVAQGNVPVASGSTGSFFYSNPTSSAQEYIIYAGSNADSLQLALTGAQQLVAVFNGAGSALHRNGVQLGGALNPGTNTLNGLSIGWDNAQTATYAFNGIMCEVAVMTGAASAADRARWDAYVLAKWGV